MDRRGFVKTAMCAAVAGAIGAAATRAPKTDSVIARCLDTSKDLHDFRGAFPGQTVYVRGYSAPGDGGGSFFSWDDTDAMLADNSGPMPWSEHD